jgi:hypothetical protein
MERRGIGAFSRYLQLHGDSLAAGRDIRRLSALRITLFQGGAIRIKRARLWVVSEYYGGAWHCNRSELLSAHVLQA